MCICLEVAEHVSKARANGLISDIVKISDCILFSAAIPMQGGEGHINENTFSYWRNLFNEHGYKCLDIIRPFIQNDMDIPFWYRNNIFVYVSEKLLLEKKFLGNKDFPFVDFINLDTYIQRCKYIEVLQNEIDELNKKLQVHPVVLLKKMIKRLIK